ncbi:LGFP repeat-containing protein [Mycobacterium sp.]|uniref:LGFP repeat-containing protein n=1 Tax=Mycobacterium sp. TaxID=1785 RepID=UPI003A88CA27
MREITKRTAAFSAAIAGFALIGTGCQATKDKASDISSSASSASSVISSAIAGSTENTQMTAANGAVYAVSGPILKKYNSLDAEAKEDLGMPLGNQQSNADGGVYQQFDGGVIVNKDAAYVVWGQIRDKWNELGGSQGKLGYPTSDESDTADGAKTAEFEHGTITWKPGDTQVTVNVN